MSCQAPSVPEFSARMVDRIALLTPRLALAGAQDDLQAADALTDLRIGLNMTQLLALRGELGRSQAALWALLEHLSRHFAARPGVDAVEEALGAGRVVVAQTVDEGDAGEREDPGELGLTPAQARGTGLELVEQGVAGPPQADALAMHESHGSSQ